MNYKHIKYYPGLNGVSELVFDCAELAINKLSFEVLNELKTMLIELEKNSSIKVLLIKSAKKGIFIAGADINEIKQMSNEEEIYKTLKKGDMIFGKLDNLPFITIAVIDGACMGGGLELALCCDFRIAVDDKSTKIGLPEVNLGVIPGLGGTQRLPKLIGVASALELILAGKIIDSKKAYRMGVIDDYIPKGYEDFKIKEFVNTVLDPKSKAQILKKRDKFRPLELLGITKEIIFSKAKEMLMKKTKGKYPAPLVALQVIKDTQDMPLDKALELEAREFAKLAVTKISKNLIDIFFTSEDLKHKSYGKFNKKIDQTALIGSGVMGKGIVWLFSNNSSPIRVKLRNFVQAGDVLQKVVSTFDFYIKTKKLTKNQVEFKTNKITFTQEYNGFNNIDFAIEAVIEDLGAKKDVYKNLESQMKNDAIIATNTSSISINTLAEELEHKERFLGVHFFNPVERMPLVEIIPSQYTSQETISKTFDFIKSCGKTPIVVNDCAGFLVNRILIPYINEAIYLFEDGVKIDSLDKELEDFGMPMGPFTLIDEVGIDIGYKVSNILYTAYGERMTPCSCIEKIYVEKKLLGKKDKKGFYIHSKDSKVVNSELYSIIKSSDKVILKDDILYRTIFTMINEAARCIEENIVEKPEYLDMAMIMGTGFPPFRGGVLKYADEVGINYVVAKLKAYEKEYGSRFEPANILQEMAKNKENFYK